MNLENIRTTSRRRTPWTGLSDATSLQEFIDLCNQDNYYKRHPKVSETREIELLNQYQPQICRYCKNENIIRYGKTATGLIRYRCKNCNKTFTILTGTIFDNRKIPITEWIDFMLSIFSYGSFNLTSKTNKNSNNTTKYWIDKLFLMLEDIQEDIVLNGRVYIDETFYTVRNSNLTVKQSGLKLRGLSKNKICIATAYDNEHFVSYVIGKGKPSQKTVFEALSSHIATGSKIIHDGDNSHRFLINNLGLEEEIHLTAETKKLKDKDNPLNPINQKHNLLKKFLNAHSGFLRDDLQDYLNLFSLITNPPYSNYEKIEKVLKWVFENPKMLRYRR